jgi:C-terminal of Roc, COR, domain
VILAQFWSTQKASNFMFTIAVQRIFYCYHTPLATAHIPWLQLWKAPDYPKQFHPFMLKLLSHFEVLHQVDDTLFIPCLNSSKPESKFIAEEWPPCPPEDRSRFGRTYRFAFIPTGFFSRLAVRLLKSLHWKPKLYWNKGISLHSPEGKLKLEVSGNILSLLLEGDPDNIIQVLVGGVRLETCC